MNFRLKSLAAGLLAVSLALPLSGCTKVSSNAKFDALSKDYFTWELSDNALSLHYCLSDPSAYDISCGATLGDFSAKKRKERRSAVKDFSSRLSAVHPQTLSKDRRLDYDVLSFFLALQNELSGYELYEEPLSPNNGIQAQLPVLLAEYAFSCREDIEAYLSLLGSIGDYFDSIMEFEREKAKTGLFMSDENCVLVIESCESFVENRDNNFLFSTFSTRVKGVEGLSAEEIAAYERTNCMAVKDCVFPAYEQMIDALTSLLGCGQNDWGLCGYENGKDYYALLLRAYTGSEKTAGEWFEEIASVRAQTLLDAQSVCGTDRTMFERASGKDWESTTEEEMMQQLVSSMQADFPEPVTTEYTLSFVEDCLKPYLAPAFYITAPYDNLLQNKIYVNPAKTTPDVSYFTTLAHEGFPGHLYQTTMSYDYGLSPMRFCLNFPGYTEGWATYAEFLSYDYAGLDETAAQVLRLNQSATLSLYASSDIGIHYLGWKTEDMQKFWADYGVTDERIVDEITRLVLSEPGSYLKYYIGYLEFENLKKEMMERYGDKFRLRDFHKAVLRMGPAPFPVLKSHFEEYYKTSH